MPKIITPFNHSALRVTAPYRVGGGKTLKKIQDSKLFGPNLDYVYQGEEGRATRYAGLRTNAQMYLGPRKIFATDGVDMTSWTPANLATAPLVILDPSAVAFSGSNFDTTPNTGSFGGTIHNQDGQVTKGTALNGHNTLVFDGSSSLRLDGLGSTGNVFVFSVVKLPTTPPAQLGAIMGQGWESDPWAGLGHVLYAQFSSPGTPPSGDSATVGDFGFWNSEGGYSVTGDIIGPSPTDGAYHMGCWKIGTDQAWYQDGENKTTSLTGNSAQATQDLPAADLSIGFSGDFGEYLTGEMAFFALLQDPTSGDIDKLNGWAAWRLGLQANLPGGHAYKLAPPTV